MLVTRRRDGVPYSFPGVAPFNAPRSAITPTPDGTGSMIHPGVVDIGEPWNGYRFWMANTPYYANNDALENPCVLASRDGYRWFVPAGLENPIYPQPSGDYNSDTDLTYDPVNDRLILVYRTGDDKTLIAASDDGVTWPGTATLAFDANGGGFSTTAHQNALSPSLVRLGASDWRIYSVWNGGGSGFVYRTATDPLGTWSAPVQCTISGVDLWHAHVIYDTEYRALINTQAQGLVAASSSDGAVWSVGGSVLTLGAGGGAAWESGGFYRSVIRPHPNGTHYHLWYTSNTTDWWRTAYTLVPRSLWD